MKKRLSTYSANPEFYQIMIQTMNGRVYDPYVQRFLSADNFIQSPDDAQSYNRYSYCLNNPLRYTDPSGWIASMIELYTIINDLWNHKDSEGNGYGGSWSSTGGTSYYTAAQGYGYYVAYNNANGWPGGSSERSSFKNYFGNSASFTTYNCVSSYDGNMNSWLLDPNGTYTNFQNFSDNKSFQLVLDNKNNVVYYSSVGFLVPVINPSGDGVERQWLDYMQIGMESIGSANTVKLKLIDFAAKTSSTLNNLKYVKFVRAAGKVITIGGVFATAYEAGSDIAKGNYYSATTRAAVFTVGAVAATTIPFVGWGVAAGIGLADAIWGDLFYNWVELNLRK